MFADYHITQDAHEGVNSKVYRARRIRDGHAVVLKMPRTDNPSATTFERYKHEYEILRGLNTDAVVRVYDLHRWQSTIVLVLEDFGGRSVAAVMTESPLQLEEALAIGAGSAAALAEIHAANVIHKDINPSNIIYDRQTGEVKLIDFDIATRLSRESPSIKDPAALEGTLAYISPEQTGRMNRSLDYRTDLYSLGVSLYQLLTQCLPFEASDAMSLIHFHIAQRPVPPQQVEPRIPKPVSDVVMKLLEKAAEHRYQSAEGLKVDLEECLRQLQHTGTVVEFPLGRGDVRGRFEIPEKLYGREASRATLLRAFEQVCQGGRRMTLVAGYSGIGKSSLVHELHRPITERHGYFIEGKFEQLQRNTPYFALVKAFQSLVRNALTEPEARIAALQKRLWTEVGASSWILADTIPGIELIVSPGAVKEQAPQAHMYSPTEQQNRFNLAFRGFVRAFAQPEHPLVLFLDDLQWIDAASLKLVEFLLSADDIGHFFVIGTYRDNEVDVAHSLTMMLENLKRDAGCIEEIFLTPLGIEDVTRLIADALRSDAPTVAPLANVVSRKTGGNPFFVNQLLLHLHQEGYLRLDRRSMKWQWNAAEIEGIDSTENVIDLMLVKLKSLPEATQQALRLAACIGHRFDLRTLSTVYGKSMADTYEDLAPAIQAEIVLPASELQIDADESNGYRLVVLLLDFLHDRVQQAAYLLIDSEKKGLAHLEIGRILRAGMLAEEHAESFFQMVDHLNKGRKHIADERERLDLARLNLEAGTRARSAMAHAAALAHLDLGVECLPEDAWTHHHELAFELYRRKAEAEYLNGDFDKAEASIGLLMGRAQSSLARAELYISLIVQFTMRAHYKEAIDAAREALRCLGIELPSENLEDAFETEVALAKSRLKGRETSLVDGQENHLPDKRAAIRALASIGPLAAIVGDQALWRLSVVMGVNLSLEYGLVPDATYCWSAYGIILVTGSDEFEDGYEFGRLALALSERFGNQSQKCVDANIVGHYLSFWVRHIGEIDCIYDEGYQAGLASGNLQWAGYTLAHKVTVDFYRGRDLEALADEIQRSLSFNAKTKNTWAIDAITAYEFAVLQLRGADSVAPSRAAESEREAAFYERCEKGQNELVRGEYCLLKLQTEYLLGNLPSALSFAQEAEGLLGVLLGGVPTAGYYFFASLAMAAAYADADEDVRERYWQFMEANQCQMKRWAGTCEENFLHKYLLVEAELARLRGDDLNAMRLYQRASRLAARQGFIQEEALAHELSSRFYRARGFDDIAAMYLERAVRAYQLWGASRKVNALVEEHPGVLGMKPAQDEPLAMASIVAPLGSSSRGTSEILDESSLVKASQAISSEIVLPRLLARLMRIVIENAGAQRGCLLLVEHEELSVEAEAEIGQENVKVHSAPIESSSRLPLSVVTYVRRSREVVILNDAAAAHDFSRDGYIVSEKPKSVLCSPIVRQGTLLGMIYLENNLATGVFTPERLSLLDVLSSQAAIALENARLYREMEQRVRERTAQLEGANKELEAFSYSVSHDLRGPLRIINVFTQALAEAVGDKLDEKAQAHLARVRKAASRMEELISDMLRLARVSKGDLRRKSVDLCAIAREICSDLCKTNPAREVEIVIPNGIRVEADPQLLAIVLENLLGNAWKFTGKRAKARIEVGTIALPDGQPACFVRDNGAGFDPEFASKLFSPFHRLHRPEDFPGSGIGLATVQRIVHRHGGRIWAESAVERGATFYFTLAPQTEDASARGATRFAATEVAATSPRTP
jgi:predicted ATPase/signal transduction histidine kinase/tRNA A-37 threonylcarbamoyl transferase component Bud32